MLHAISLIYVSTAYQTPLKLDYVATPLKVILADVERQTGLKLNPGPLANRPVIAKVSAMTSKPFLDELARALDARWEMDGETLRLSRGLGQIRVAQDKESAERAVWMKAAMQKIVESKKEGEDWSDAAIQKRKDEDDKRRAEIMKGVTGGGRDMVIEVVGTSGISPADMFIAEAMRRTPPKTFASIQPGQRVVFSNFANRMQRSLPYVSSKFPDFVRAYNRMATQPADTTPGIRFNDARSPRGKEPINGVAELLMIAKRYADMLQVTILAVGQNGDILGRGMATLSPPAVADGLVPDNIKGEAVLSDDSKKLVKAIQSGTPSNQSFSFQLDLGGGIMGSFATAESTEHPPTLPKDLQTLLSQPATNEPLATFPSEVWRQTADLNSRDLIAVLPDSAFATMAKRLATGKIKIADLYKAAPHLGLEVSGTSAIVVTPRVQAQADRTNIDRNALESLLSGFVRNGYSRLDDVCRYSLKMPEPVDTNLDQVLLKLVSPGVHSQLSPHQLGHERLYGALTPGQKQADRNQAAVSYVQMDATQKALTEALVYKAGEGQMFGEGQMLMVTRSASPAGTNQPQVTPQIMQQEPTEAMPNGVPQNAVLTMTRKWSDGVLAVNTKGVGSFLSAGDLGLRLGMDRSGMPAEMQTVDVFTSYNTASIMDMSMAIAFGRQNRAQGNLRDANPLAGSAVSYDKLPPQFKAQVEQAKKAAANMRTMSVGRGGGPPPPTR